MIARLQDLKPVDARLCLRVGRFITEELALELDGRALLVAVSGGADSTALLHILRFLRPRLGMELHAATLDHGLRPGSGAETSAVLALCRDLDLPCTARSLPVAAHAARLGLGLEEAGRALRYAALEEERRRLGADWTVTGHQRDDLEEDVLLRFLRGTGWPGLGGMTAADASRRILRPLLLTPARELRAFLLRNGLPWLEDESNADPRFLRNRVRLEILPRLAAESPRLGEHIVNLWRMARLDEAHWDRALERFNFEKFEPLRADFRENPRRETVAEKTRFSRYDEGSYGRSRQRCFAAGQSFQSGNAAGGTTAEPEERDGGIRPDQNLLRKLDKASRLRLYMRIIARLNGERPAPPRPEVPDGEKNPASRKNGRPRRGQARASALFALDKAWAEGRDGAILQFPGGIAAEVRRGSVRFFGPDARRKA
jgi:tRNA(Ile)-lysidine synthase